MIEYDILCDTTIEGLVEQVKMFIAQGWRPIGGVTLTFTGVAQHGVYEGINTFMVAQAMTRDPLRGGT